MRLWVSRHQWRTWSLPSRLTAIGTLVGVVSLVLYIGEKTFGVFNASQLDIGYLDFELEGKDVQLLTKLVDPPTSRVQRHMLVDPNNPSIFGLYGVWIKNVGHSQMETLNMSIHLNMSAEVTQPAAVLSCWRPFPSSEVGYVTEFLRRRCSINKPGATKGHSLVCRHAGAHTGDEG
jgi:hypothetical protein